MKIINETHWRSDQIKKLVRAVAKLELQPQHAKRLIVRVEYLTTRGGCQAIGWAYYGTMQNPSRTLWLKMPRPHHGPNDGHLGSDGKLDIVLLAHTVGHEIGHLKGIKHRDMTGPRYSYVDGWRELYAWAKDYSVEEMPKPTKATPEERTTKKLAHAERMLKIATRKLRLATTIEKKWRRRVSALKKRPAIVVATSGSQTGRTLEAAPSIP